ncbi:MAG: Excinuclease subunit domain protein [Firmicutes bacterium]|nr:Excinuclease subunit domain protein [Bacillota bacterium]
MILSVAIYCPVLYKFILMKLKDKERHQRWTVYILRCTDGSFYTGVTNGLEKRLMGHGRGTASKYTRSRRPVTLLATSVEMNKGEALRLEIKIKKMPKAKKVACLKSSRSENKDSP